MEEELIEDTEEEIKSTTTDETEEISDDNAVEEITLE